MRTKYTLRRFPAYGYAGLIMVIIFWYLNWSLKGLRTDWGFFPLWLGYCLTVDALVFVRKGSSMLKRSLWKYISLFLISAPCWWLFELFNNVLQNWHYEGREYFTDTEYFLLASLSFSTVMPAVLGTAELASTFSWIKNSDGKIFGSRLRIKPEVKTLLLCFSAGCIFLLLILSWPEYFFYLVWISLYLIIEPVNSVLKNTTLFNYTATGNWKPLKALWAGVMICALFWEMWNYYSYPKWVYYLPIANFLHVFEMPLPGYIGYLPFSMELYALYNLISGTLGLKNTEEFLQLWGQKISREELLSTPERARLEIIPKKDNSEA